MADVQANHGDGDGDNQHDKTNKGRGPYVTSESQWVTMHTWKEGCGLGCRAGRRLLESLYPLPF